MNATATELELKTKWLIRADIKEVTAIDEKKNFWWAWPEEKVLSLLKEPNVIGISVETCDLIIGFAIYKIEKENQAIRILKLEAYSDDAEQVLMNKLKGKLASVQKKFLIWDVEESKLNRHIWLKNSNFCALGIKKGFFLLENEDSYTFLYKLHEKDVFSGK